MDHGALNLGDGKVDENPENWLRRLAFTILCLLVTNQPPCTNGVAASVNLIFHAMHAGGQQRGMHTNVNKF